jgi:hypothetical protein
MTVVIDINSIDPEAQDPFANAIVFQSAEEPHSLHIEYEYNNASSYSEFYIGNRVWLGLAGIRGPVFGIAAVGAYVEVIKP